MCETDISVDLAQLCQCRDVATRTMHDTPLELLILGGQGALASAEFHCRLIHRLAESVTFASDAAYPRVLHWSEALPGLGVQGLEQPEVAYVELYRRIQRMPFSRPPLVVLPCNSLEPVAQRLNAVCSQLHAQAEPAAQTPMILEALTPWSLGRSWLAYRQQPTLVMGSRSLQQALLHDPTRPGHVQPCDEAQQTLSDAVIEAVVAGKLREARAALAAFLDKQGLPRQHVLLACTELSVAQPQDRFPYVSDTLDLLVAFSASRLKAGRK